MTMVQARQDEVLEPAGGPPAPTAGQEPAAGLAAASDASVLVTARRAGEILGLSRRQSQRLSSVIAGVRSTNGKWLFRLEDVEAYRRTRVPRTLRQTDKLTPEWKTAVHGFTAYTSHRSPATAADQVRHVEWLAASVAEGPWTIGRIEIEEWLDGQNWSNETRRKVLVSLRAFYAWGVREGFIEWAPVAGLPSAKPRTRGPARIEFPPAWVPEVDGYLQWIRAGGRCEGTQGTRRYHLLRLAEVCADPWSASTEQLAAYLSNPDWKPNTRRSHRSTIREFYRWAVKTGRIAESPAIDLEPVLRPRMLPHPTPDDSLRHALGVADDRTRLAIMFAALGGLRRSEIAGLHTRDVNQREMFIVGKGGHHRQIPMHPQLWEEFCAEMARRRAGRPGTGWHSQHASETGYVFPSDRSPGPITPGHLGKIVARVLPDAWTTHSLRHRFATLAYAEQRDLLTVQQLLGHSKPETTARYAAVPDGALTRAVAAVRL